MRILGLNKFKLMSNLTNKKVIAWVVFHEKSNVNIANKADGISGISLNKKAPLKGPFVKYLLFN